MCNVRGTSHPELCLPGEEEEICVVVLQSQDETRKPQQTKMLVGGVWIPFVEERLSELLAPPVEDEVEVPDPEELYKYYDEGEEVDVVEAENGIDCTDDVSVDVECPDEDE